MFITNSRRVGESARHWTATGRGFFRRRKIFSAIAGCFTFNTLPKKKTYCGAKLHKNYFFAPTRKSFFFFFLFINSALVFCTSCSGEAQHTCWIFFFTRGSRSSHSQTRKKTFPSQTNNFPFELIISTHNLRPRYHVTVMWLFAFLSFFYILGEKT